MPLLKKQLKHLISLAHNLRPIIMIGQQGVTENILNELEIAIEHHELVKIKIAGEDRDSRNKVIERLIKASSAEAVQKIGKTLTLYRRNHKKPRIDLP